MDGRGLIALVALLLIGLQLQIRSGAGVAGPTQLRGDPPEQRQASLRRLGIDLASSTVPVLR